MTTISVYANSPGLLPAGVDALEYAVDFSIYLFEINFPGIPSWQQTDMDRMLQNMPVSPNSLSTEPLEPISLDGVAKVTRDKHSILEPVCFFPNTGNTVPALSTTLGEEPFDLGPALQAGFPGKPIFFDQHERPVVFCLSLGVGPALSDHPWWPCAPDNRGR